MVLYRKLTLPFLRMTWNKLLKGLALQPAPQVRPSKQPLTINPQKVDAKSEETLKFAPQKLWQTLKNFDYPPNLIHSISFLKTLIT